MNLTCYYDFTCEYSYRAWMWIERLKAAGTEIDVDWRPFVLKEVNRDGADPSLLAGPTIDSVAVLALAAAEALRGHAGSDTYRSETFHAMHDREERPNREEVMEIAERAALDTDSFWSDETLWLATVRDSHEGAVGRWGVFGTPTLVFADAAAIYLKLADLPAGDDRELWNSVTTITTKFPEITELKRPSRTETSPS